MEMAAWFDVDSHKKIIKKWLKNSQFAPQDVQLVKNANLVDVVQICFISS